MNTTIQQRAILVGVHPKKGTGTLNDGSKWETDRVELHCLIPLDQTKGAKGSSVQIFKVQDHDKYKDLAMSLLDQEIVIDISMVAGAPGAAPKLTPLSFQAVKKSA